MNERPYAHIAVNRPLAPLTYRVPAHLRESLEPGCLVEVPLGAAPEIGCLIEFADAPPAGVAEERLRFVTKRVSPDYVVNDELRRLAAFVSDYYFCSPGEALCTASMVGFNDVHPTPAVATFRFRHDWEHALGQSGARLTRRQRETAEALALSPPLEALTLADLSRVAGASVAILRKLVDAGVLVPPEVELANGPINDFAAHLLPNDAQQSALDRILNSVRAPRFDIYLLHGITGSGKTEVYLQAIAEVLHRGGTALCLLPEISLTPQTLARFEHRFRTEIGVFHSQLTRRHKLDLYRRIRDGRIRIVIGARSAVFAPLPNLGIVILDEEHDGSYKQNELPRYHARDTAIYRASKLGIPVVLGSATPSLESFHNARTGKYHLLTLDRRATDAGLPPVRLIDLASIVQQGEHAALLSPDLVAGVRARLDRGEQSLLFLNRRGFSSFVMCPSCKWVARCEEDDVTLTVHTKGRTREPMEQDLFAMDAPPEQFLLRCHFCGGRHPMPVKCPECANEGLMRLGAGTQRVEEELERLFPGARLMRLDQDTAGSRTKYLAAWETIMRGEVDILFGTQMLAKGLHLEGITLVGVVLADIGLFLPDFRADERTFQLLTQVAGRSGRVSAGEVIFQTWMPRNPAIHYAVTHDYNGFAEFELNRRRRLGFPPHARLIALTLSDPDRDRAFAGARQLAYLLTRTRTHAEATAIRVNGPTVAPLGRLGGRYRYRILMRAAAWKPMAGLLRRCLSGPDWTLAGTSRLAIDVDPVDLL